MKKIKKQTKKFGGGGVMKRILYEKILEYQKKIRENTDRIVQNVENKVKYWIKHRQNALYFGERGAKIKDKNV